MKCPKCNSSKFFVEEVLLHEAELAKEQDDTVAGDKDTLLATPVKDNCTQIQKIFCANDKCSEEMDESEFNNIEFC